MFTGIIENLSEIKEINKEGDNLSISLISKITDELKIDQSLSHNGVCLTVVDINDNIYKVTAIKETILKRIEKRKILEKRSDDDLNTILKRYDTYMETTRPVLDFYSKNSNFHEIDGTMEIDQITSKINTFIEV